jgi:predicted PolB exonuclease-like 3'-5' exonuclease
VRYLTIDLETAPLPNAADYLDPVEAAKNLKDPEKIKADLERRQQEQLENCGLDWNLNRIVALGLAEESQLPVVWLAEDEAHERQVLTEFASFMRNPRPQLLGFCIRRFDVPVLLQRARYLGVALPKISLKRYDNPHLTDLFDLLTFDEQPCTTVMRRTLNSFCRRFGIPNGDEHKGADIAALVSAGEWQAVSDHCLSDLAKTRALAEKLGVLDAQVASIF